VNTTQRKTATSATTNKYFKWCKWHKIQWNNTGWGKGQSKIFENNI